MPPKPPAPRLRSLLKLTTLTSTPYFLAPDSRYFLAMLGVENNSISRIGNMSQVEVPLWYLAAALARSVGFFDVVRKGARSITDWPAAGRHQHRTPTHITP